jgi:hypothetical protein
MRKMPRGLFVAVVLISSLSLLQIIPSAQNAYGVVHLLYPNNCPIKIRALKVGEESIEPQKPFAAAKDWLKSLSWEVENTWGRSAAYVEIDLDFHELGGLRGRVFKHQYGRGPNTPGSLDNAQLLGAGQRTRMIISDEEYMRINRFIEERQPNLAVSIVEIKVAKVVFDDGTPWP